MWKYQDRKMQELRNLYQKRSQVTQNRLQEAFNLLNIDELNVLYSIADDAFKRRVNAYIDEWREKGYLRGYFGMKAEYIYRRKKVKLNEVLELFIYYAFIEEGFDLEDKEEEIFKDVINHYYEEGQRQAGVEKPKKLSEKAFLAMMAIAGVAGYTWKEYKYSYMLNNTYEIYRIAVQMIQQGRKPNIDLIVFKNIIKKQLDRLIKIKNGKISGEADNTLIGKSNQAILDGILDSGAENPKVRFIAVMDDRTTPMCRSLDGQEFYLLKENRFKRYSDTYESVRWYECFGMVLGLNLPPINDHFHWCRSTIEYVKQEP